MKLNDQIKSKWDTLNDDIKRPFKLMFMENKVLLTDDIWKICDDIISNFKFTK